MRTVKLLDNFNRAHDYLRISLTDACNLRCLYCMPNEKVLVTPNSKMMQAEEILKIAETFVELGIKKIRLTGGEPLVRKDAKEIIIKLSKLPVNLTISTNAILVDEYIDVFKEAKINSINISLDTLNPEVFFEMTKRRNFEKIMDNILLLLKNNFKIKINIVVLRGLNENSLFDFIELTKRHPIDVRFIEFMPFDGNNWKKENVFSYAEMLEEIKSKYQVQKIEDLPNDTAKHFKANNYKGKFAFISTITEPFCDSCNRLRLTADGKIKNCLFSNGEIDLLQEFRAGNDIRPLIISSVLKKEKELGGKLDFGKRENRSMIKIGG